MSDAKTIIFQKRLLIACCVFAFIALSFSFLTQYVWHIEPCRLCKLQRIPYYFLLVTPLLELLKIKYGVIKTLMLCFLAASLILSSYHLLVINGLVKDFCAVPSGLALKEDYMNKLETHVPCSRAGWSFLGIPMAGYNLIFSIFFLFLFSKKVRIGGQFSSVFRKM